MVFVAVYVYCDANPVFPDSKPPFVINSAEAIHVKDKNSNSVGTSLPAFENGMCVSGPPNSDYGRYFYPVVLYGGSSGLLVWLNAEATNHIEGVVIY